MKRYIILFTAIFFIVGCQEHTAEQETMAPTTTIPSPETLAEPQSTSTFPLLPSPETTPEFIVAVSPPESTIIPFNLFQSDLTNGQLYYEGVRDAQGGYNNSLCVALEFFAIDIEYALASNESQVTEVIPFDERKNRVNIWLDGVLLTNVNKDLWWGPSGHTFCWQADADIGSHEVVFQLVVTSADIRNYTWFFAISGEPIPLATFTPKP
jgi:hypothetical protein